MGARVRTMRDDSTASCVVSGESMTLRLGLAVSMPS
jgi:hypothetical protein